MDIYTQFINSNKLGWAATVLFPHKKQTAKPTCTLHTTPPHTAHHNSTTHYYTPQHHTIRCCDNRHQHLAANYNDGQTLGYRMSAGVECLHDCQVLCTVSPTTTINHTTSSALTVVWLCELRCGAVPGNSKNAESVVVIVVDVVLTKFFTATRHELCGQNTRHICIKK